MKTGAGPLHLQDHNIGCRVFQEGVAGLVGIALERGTDPESVQAILDLWEG